MNKKTYWWRIVALLIPIGGAIIGYVVFYPYEFHLCNYLANDCIFSSLKKNFAEPLFLFSLTSLIIPITLFFVKDSIFLKWLRLALVWIVVSIFLIVLIPDQQPGLFSFGGPSKEDLSIFFGSLFVILSLGKIGWEWWKERSLPSS